MLVRNPPVQITDRLWMLGANEFPLYFYRCRGQGTIIEGGVSALGPRLRQQLQELGIAPDFVRQVIVTHAHPDHVMAVPVLRQMFPGLLAIASEPAARTLSMEKAVSFFCKMDNAFATVLSAAEGAAGEAPWQAESVTHIAIDRVVREGDVISLDDDLSLHVLETPGHSDCSLSFHEPSENVLIISDATGYYMPDLDFMWPNYFAGYDAYLRSIGRLADIGAEVLCLSHNGAIRGAAEAADYLRRCLEAAERYHEHILAEARAGKTPEQIAEALGAAVYEKTRQLNATFFQKNCSLLVRNSLQHAGLVPGG